MSNPLSLRLQGDALQRLWFQAKLAGMPPRTLAQRTLRVVAQNLAFAAAYNALCIPLALAGLLPPWLAGIGMAGSSLVVVLNALRLAPRASVMAQRAPSVSAPSPAMT